MKPLLQKKLLLLVLLIPLLNGCFDDDDDDDDAPLPTPISDGGDDDDADPNSIRGLFAASADGEPIAIDDRDALLADIQMVFGATNEDPKEPEDVLDLSNE